MDSATPPSQATVRQPVPGHAFAMQFTSTPRGARLARRLVSHRLDDWGHPYTSPANEAVTLITAELASNAVRHGHVPGRDFHVRLTETPAALRVEVSDTRSERLPLLPAVPSGNAECGRGLVIVAHLATRWAIAPRPEAPGKTIWAELDLASRDEHGNTSSSGYAVPMTGSRPGVGPSEEG